MQYGIKSLKFQAFAPEGALSFFSTKDKVFTHPRGHSFFAQIGQLSIGSCR